jgi:hypothetical protein
LFNVFTFIPCLKIHFCPLKLRFLVPNENDAEIFPVCCTWKVAERGFKMALMMNKLAMIISCEIILEK